MKEIKESEKKFQVLTSWRRDNLKNMFGFVVLHYCSLNDTRKCVESIRNKFDIRNYHIVIVDNNSPDNSGTELKELYKGSNDISIILNAENLGFARGNNVGFLYLKKRFDCDFICVMNSDTILVDNTFGKCIYQDYEKYHFYVLGPNVQTRKDICVNPIDEHCINYEESLKKIWSLKVQLVLNIFCLDEIIRKLKQLISNSEKTKVRYDRKCYYENVKLHGCCLIFSKDYIKTYDGFNNSTFLYLEEELLYIMMKMDNRKTLYSPNVHIFHKEDGSTDKIVWGHEKRRFILKNHLRSMCVIRDYLYSNNGRRNTDD